MRALVLLLALCGCEAADPLSFTQVGTSRDAVAYYSIAVEPLPGAEGGFELEPGEYVVITFTDTGYACAASPPGDVDAISFFFLSDMPGASTSLVAGRGGPHLGTTTAGTGEVVIEDIDDRYLGFDNQMVHVVPGGHVTGHVRYVIDDFVLEGHFTAPHCAALDFIVPG
jgi:hypothetical protein